jgi:hypothetical protein
VKSTILEYVNMFGCNQTGGTDVWPTCTCTCDYYKIFESCTRYDRYDTVTVWINWNGYSGNTFYKTLLK